MIAAIMGVQPHDRLLSHGVLALWSGAVPPGDLAAVRPHLSQPRTSLRDDAGRLHGDSATLIAVSVTDVAKSAAQRPEAILANLTC